MAYLDFKDLQDQVLSRGYGETDRIRVKAWLNEAAEDVNRQGRWYFNETRWTVTTTPGTQVVNLAALSPSLQYFGAISPNDADTGSLVYVPYDNANPDQPFRNYDASTGRPFYYTLVGDNSAYLLPTPDGAYSYRIDGWKRHTQMVADADTPAIPQEHRHVLIYLALAKAAERDKDPSMMDYWDSRSQRALSELRRYDQVGRQTQGPLKVSMPDHYHGRFD